FMASTLHRVCSLSNFRRTITRDNFANVMRPKVAAAAATTASKTKSMLGIVRPMNDMAVQVGGAKAGSRFSTKIAMNSTTVIFVTSLNSATASLTLLNIRHSLRNHIVVYPLSNHRERKS